MPMLKWAGKEKVVNHHNDVPFRVLERKWGFCSHAEARGRGDFLATKDAKSTKEDGKNLCELCDLCGKENMIIHGDNLAALKALLPQYEGRVKCIYIDPPYNTGNEGWVYNDNVNDPQIKKWLGEVVGKEGEDFSRHDKWLCMMYPRLRLLQKLLTDDGVIFISIDDNELYNLKFICDEIFGAQNYVDRITVIVKTEGRRYGFFAKTHENVLVYARNLSSLKLNQIMVEGKQFEYRDEKGGFNLQGLRNRNVRAFNSTNRPNLRYPFYVDATTAQANGLYRVSVMPKDGWTEVNAQTIDGLESVWRWGKEKANNEIFDLCACKGRDGEFRIFQKTRKISETPKTVWFDKSFTSIFGTKELSNIFGKPPFDFPKPISLIQRLIEIGSDKDAIVLDSFAGSGTTAHAVLKMNKEDGGNRKFILIEMMDYADTVTAERVKRVISGYGEGDKAVEGTGGGFGYYELGDPLMIGENLNEDLPLEKIREYVWYMETRGMGSVANVEVLPIANANSQSDNGNIGIGNIGNIGNTKNDPYLLGVVGGAAYYFCYEKGSTVKLNRALLRKLKTKAERYVIYADICLLDDSELEKYNITFKKIPRDIARL